jgi:hypothetical protein
LSSTLAEKEFKFEDIKGVIRRINRRTDYAMNNRKRTNKDPQNIIQKTEDRETRTPLTAGVNSCSSQGLSVPAPHVASVVLLLNDTNNM